MDSLDGIELAAALRKLGDGTAIIFISSNREMALRSYEVSAARYLAKPLQRPQLREARLPECQFIFCHRSYLVNLEHIAYIRSRELKLTNGEVLPVSRYRLENLQKRFVDYLHT